ncbi:calcium/proton exchanger [Candidatus Micrarchaeota archaeon]|nr:calcium/proton exchanger [Candidatus Micrarchaeota archaeon]
MKIGKFELGIMDLLLIFVPVSLALSYLKLADSSILFIVSLLGILPLASKMGEATEELAKIYGGQIGGLLNATFGNAAELIIALIAISRGLEELVKASLSGSIIGNLLFVLGMSMLAGGMKYKEQKFSPNLAGLNSTMLLIAFLSIMIPSMFHFVPVQHRGNDEQTLSMIVSILLIILYLMSMIFSLKTHQHLFKKSEEEKEEKAHWSRNFAILVLIASTVLLALVSEVFVGQIESIAHEFGLTELFIGAVIVAVVGNAAEHMGAIFFALKNDIELSINVTAGSSLQIAMFVAPVCVLAASIIQKPMDLVFTPFEIIAVFASVLIVNEISSDGRCNWFEGAQLIVMYLIIAALFFFVR